MEECCIVCGMKGVEHEGICLCKNHIEGYKKELACLEVSDEFCVEGHSCKNEILHCLAIARIFKERAKGLAKEDEAVEYPDIDTLPL